MPKRMKRFATDPLFVSELAGVDYCLGFLEQELRPLPQQDRRMLLKMLAQGFTSELFRVRTYAAAICCTRQLKEASTVREQAKATATFLEAFRRCWAEGISPAEDKSNV